MAKIICEPFHGDYDINVVTEDGTFLERIGVFYGDKAKAERVARLLNDPLIALVSVDDIHKALIAQNIGC